jgi:hypothetical protein
MAGDSRVAPGQVPNGQLIEFEEPADGKAGAVADHPLK